MAVGNFDRCYARVRVYEGGNDDDPRDPGGRTSRGILQREYDRFLVTSGKSAIIADHDVWKASEADIAAIYRANYWDRARCEELPAGVDFTVFDSGVNSGVSQAAKWAQRATGIRVDGDFGPGTVHALTSAPDNDVLVGDILARRLAMLQGLKTWKFYGKGWSARIANVLKTSQAWATGSVGPDPVAVHEISGHRKGNIEDVRQPFIPVSLTSVASTSGTIGTSAGGVASQLQPVASMFPERLGAIVLGIVGALTIAAVVANQISTAAQKRADATKASENTAEIDTEADSGLQPVPVNDNAPAAQAGAA